MGSRLESNSNAVRKRIEQHTFDGDAGEEYEASKFGGFPEYFRRKKIKLQNLDAERRRLNVDKPPIFRGVVAHVNGYTQPSMNDLHALIVDYGGGFLQYLDGKTMATHVIASNLTSKKAEEFRKYRIVKPAWVIDSIDAGKLLPWSNYRVVDGGTSQNVLGFEGNNITSIANRDREGYKNQMNTSWYTDKVQAVAARVDGLGQTANEDVRNREPAREVEDDELDDEAGGEDATEIQIAQHASLSQSFGVEGLDDSDFLGMENALNTATSPGDRTIQDHDENRVGFDIDVARTAAQVFLDRDKGTSTSNIAQKDEGQVATTSDISPKKVLTAEEHNAALLSDPRIWKSSVANPGFLKQYYEESRLHHLSTWKAELKARLLAMAQERSASQKARRKRPHGARRYVLHVDFDCFFAAVSLKQYPQYQDKPVVVAHGSGAGAEIASCNYHARKFGVKNGMWMKSAQDLCSDIKVLPYDFKAYEKASQEFYAAVMDIEGIVQSVSIDEALVDVSMLCTDAENNHTIDTRDETIRSEQLKADEIGNGLRRTIKEKTGCAVSVGIGGNILLAKVALRKAKPAGQYQIKPDEVLNFIGDLSVRDLPGVAYSIGGKLEEIGVKLVKDVRALTKERLMTTLGPKTGERIWEYSRGIDRVEVGEQVARKSVSAEVTWGVRFVNQDQADVFVRSLCEELHRRLEQENVKGRQLTMKILRRAADAGLDPPKHLGHGKCDAFNKSVVLGVSTNDANILAREAVSIMKGYGFPAGELRGIGVQMTKLEPLKDFSALAGGQKRLQFQTAEPNTASVEAEGQDETSDNVETPKKAERSQKHPAAAFSHEGLDASGSKLNTLGTQFILPTQVDPDILAELPEHIRKKLSGPAKSLKKDPKDAKQPKLEFKSRAESPQSPDTPSNGLLSTSQIDSETLAALPEEIREEILSFYKNETSPSADRQKNLLQSPHKSRVIKQPAKTTTPKKRDGRSRGIRVTEDPHTGLQQSNLVTTRSEEHEETISVDEIPPDLLDELPTDIRAEVLAEQRSLRLQHQSGLSVPARRQMYTDLDSEDEEDRVLELPPRPPRPTFTAQKLSTLPELRDAVSAWVNGVDSDGPGQEDVDTLIRYLTQVVREERDLEKAVAVVKWLVWLVGELQPELQLPWFDPAHQIREGVQAAATERDLGEVQFQ